MAASRSGSAVEVCGDNVRRVSVDVVTDSEVELYVNGARAATMTATDECLDALAIGYIIGKGLARSVGEIRPVEVKGMKVYARAAPEVALRPVKSERSEAGIDVRCLFHDVLRSYELGSAAALYSAHLSVIFSSEGCMISYALDTDRHSSLFKAIGKALMSSMGMADSVVVCSGRIDSHMALTACRAGACAIVSPSSPTDKAVDIAGREGMMLMRFESPASVQVYCGEKLLSGLEFFGERSPGPTTISYL